MAFVLLVVGAVEIIIDVEIHWPDLRKILRTSKDRHNCVTQNVTYVYYDRKMIVKFLINRAPEYVADTGSCKFCAKGHDTVVCMLICRVR